MFGGKKGGMIEVYVVLAISFGHHSVMTQFLLVVRPPKKNIVWK